MIPRGGIAVFDSGIGGLTVLEECRKRLPDELFYYYGDNSYAPYGNRSEKEILHRVNKAMQTFRRLKAKAVVLACNTATAVCIDELRKRYAIPIIGTEPAVELGAKAGGEVFIFVTKATSRSQRFQRLYEVAAGKYTQAKLRVFAFEHLAEAIEKNLTRADFDVSAQLPQGRPNAVVLGCTHYVFIKREIEKRYGCVVVDGNDGIARRLQSVLENNKITRARTRKKLKKRFLQPFLTTVETRGVILNKRSSKKGEKRGKNEASANVVFLRKTKGFNEKTHKQMFGFAKNGQKSIFGGQKIKKN